MKLYNLQTNEPITCDICHRQEFHADKVGVTEGYTCEFCHIFRTFMDWQKIKVEQIFTKEKEGLF